MLSIRPTRCLRTLSLPQFCQIYLRCYSTKNSSIQTFREEPRINAVGIQYLSKKLDRLVFPSKEESIELTQNEKDLIELSKKYLDTHGLLGKKTTISEPISFDFPKLEGNNMDEHFRKLASFASDPYLNYAKEFAALKDLPEKPSKWLFESGWYKYNNDGSDPVKVEYPEDDALVFDVETLYKVSNYPVMATAVSNKAWYGWVSPKLTGESESFDHLIPLNTIKQEKVIVGHNVSYDRARIKEEYNLKDTKAFYLDTMSLHVAASGMCSQQRARWMEHRKMEATEELRDEDAISQSEIDDPWINYSSPNSLADLAQFYFKKKVDKDIRNTFSGEDISVIREDFQNLMEYCANDVLVTHKVFSHVFPEFLKVCPHPVSFAALKFMGAGILTTNKDWYEYIERAESLYQKNKAIVGDKLIELVEDAVKLRDNPEIYTNDPWLSQLDWEIVPIRYKKNGEPYKRQRLPGYPNWYKELYSTKEEKIVVTTRSRVTPLLLKLKWEGYPVVWDDRCGWCFKADKSDKDRLIEKNYVHEPYFGISSENLDEALDNGTISEFEQDLDYCFFRVPHNQGPENRTTLLLAKGYSVAFEKEILKSDLPLAKEALDLNASCSYWISSRERIMSQFVVDKTKKYSIIIPQVVTMGTITRRAVERTWLTASNAKKTRIGSELKSKVIAPPGYCLVGADVDSEELWIASLVGDAMFKIHGGTAIGWMTLEGTKSEGTDLHSKTAKILGISRNEAKIFNYGRIYGAGVKFATTLLKQFNPNLSDSECSQRAKNLYSETKGQTLSYTVDNNRTKIWYGGSESVLFNELERIANNKAPKTPVLGAGITKALMKKNLNTNSFLPSRVNWAIQSSGVDYLHLLCVSMNFLIKKYSIDARLSLSVHDEIRYLVKEKDKYRAAMALQISNVWTRAIFSENLGMKELPQSCAFFSEVDVDHILRKEVTMDCVTPSNPTPEPSGESLNINQLLEKPDAILSGGKTSKIRDISESSGGTSNKVQNDEQNVTESYKFSHDNPEWRKTVVEMQISQSSNELRNRLRNYRRYGDLLNFKDVLSGELVTPIVKKRDIQKKPAGIEKKNVKNQHALKSTKTQSSITEKLENILATTEPEPIGKNTDEVHFDALGRSLETLREMQGSAEYCHLLLGADPESFFSLLELVKSSEAKRGSSSLKSNFLSSSKKNKGYPEDLDMFFAKANPHFGAHSRKL